VYSTCSIEPEENEEVVAAVVSEQQSARVVAIQKRIAALGTERDAPGGMRKAA